MALALTVSGAALLPWPAWGQDDTRPALWSGTAAAAGVQLSLNSDPRLVPIDELVHLSAPDVFTSWTPTVAVARAAPVYPGTSGTGGPRLLCDFQFPCPPGFPPDYPLSASAQHPTHPDASTPDNSARAHAGAEEVWAEASGSGPAAAVLTALAEVAELQGVTAVTRQWFDEGVLNVTAETAIQRAVLLGGLVTIDGMRARVETRVGDGVRQTLGRVELGAVTAAGQPASIDEHGITIGEVGVPADEARRAQEALAEALREHQTEIRLVGTTRHDGDGQGALRSEAIGLLVSTRVDVAGPPLPLPASPFRAYVATMRLGHAGAEAHTGHALLGLGSGAGLLDGTGVAGVASPTGRRAPGPADGVPGSSRTPPLAGASRPGESAGPGGAAPVAGDTAVPEPPGSGGVTPSRLRLLYVLTGTMGVAALVVSRLAGRFGTRAGGLAT